MDYSCFKYSFTHSFSLKLIRSENAPFILSFLYSEFKRRNRISIPYSELLEALSSFLEDVNTLEKEPLYGNTPQGYLDNWCDEDHRYLRKYYETHQDDPLFELTPDTEKVLIWFQDLDKKEFIGTESRFLRVFELLKEIVEQSNENPDQRIALLKQQRKAIDLQIRKIEKTGIVESLTSTQIKERFIEAKETAYHLLSDFREVEQNFKDFARMIQRKRLGEKLTKGSLLQFILDTDDAIKESDQGRSFYAFYQFLNSPRYQEKMESLVEAIYLLEEIQSSQVKDDRILKYLKNDLIDAGEKIIASNHRLSEQLRRMLDEKILLENRRAASLLLDIKKQAFQLAVNPPRERRFLCIDGNVEINLPMERREWRKPQIPSFQSQAIDVSIDELGSIDLSELFNQFTINIEQLRRNIQIALLNEGQLTLAELIDRNPIEQGIAQVLGYFYIASQDGYDINDEIVEGIMISQRDRQLKTIRIPQIIFRKERI